MMTQTDIQRADTVFSGSDEEKIGHRWDEFIPEDAQFTGEELDEEADVALESIPREAESQGAEGRHGGKRWLWICIALSLCVVAGLGYLSVSWERLAGTSDYVKKIPQQPRLPVPEDKLILFHSLIIPFHESKNFAYLSFSISFYVPNKKVRREIKSKKSQLRGIIYDMLAQEINKMKDVPPLETLKELILSGVNASLSMGTVREAYITKFLAV